MEDHAARWWRDRWLLVALAAALVVRVAPMVLWWQIECIRDECIYRAIAQEIVAGRGLTVATKGWLPAPGYPYLLAWSKLFTGSMQAVKILQIALSVASVGIVYEIGRIVSNRAVGRVAAWLLALNPTMAWFATTLWIETIYTFFLLAAAWATLVAHRDERPLPAALAGGSLGVAVLFRGIATYLPPLFVLALVWPRGADDERPWVDRMRAGWRRVALFVIAGTLVVAPWSIPASARYGGPLVSDVTVGHVLWLGNNDFPPLTFDYGNGMLTEPLFDRYLNTGRPPCSRELLPVPWNRCQVREALGWIVQHPGEFVSRVPVRLAQILNPHSFFTRHLRWGYWDGLPWGVKEGLVLLIAAFSCALIGPGTVAAWAKARGPWAVLAVGISVYTLGVTAIMYGMTRFRLPLEALFTVYLAMAIVHRAEIVGDLAASRVRLVGVALTLPPLLALTMWYLPTGWPMLW